MIQLIKKFVLPPLFPLAAILLLCAWTMAQEVDFINGRPDNAPGRSAAMILTIWPIFYAIFAALNLIDSATDRFHGRGAWFGTSGLIVCLALFFAFAGLGAEPDTSRYLESLMFGLGASLTMLLPMSFLRRHFSVRSRQLPLKSP